MCGIAGQVGFRHWDEAGLQRMLQVLGHRGPDDEGTYRADGVALGQRRLSIIDVAGGRQPIANEDGTIWVVCRRNL